MSKELKGKEIGFLLGFPFGNMMNPLASSFFSNQTNPFSSPFFSNQPAPVPRPQQQQQNAAQTQAQTAPQQQQGGFGFDSMFQNAKTFMGYIDQMRPAFNSLGPMMKMLTGSQAQGKLVSRSGTRKLARQSVYIKNNKR